MEGNGDHGGIDEGRDNLARFGRAGWCGLGEKESERKITSATRGGPDCPGQKEAKGGENC
jgi:hypothetical protein